MNLILKIDILLFVITVLFTGYNLFFHFGLFCQKKKGKTDHVKTQSIVVIFAAYKEDQVIKRIC